MEPSGMAKRIWHLLRAVCYMLCKGISKRKLMLELHLLLQRGKLAGKAIGNLMTLHSHHHHRHHHYDIGRATNGGGPSSFSCRSMDTNLAYYNPQEVEFSCSNTPAYSLHSLTKRSSKHRRRRHDYDFDAATIAKAFEILNSTDNADGESSTSSIVASPSPAPLWVSEKSPAVPVRRVRITDSPFPIREDEDGGRVDRAAEDFIKRFYEQLRHQMAAATPEYNVYRRKTLVGRA